MALPTGDPELTKARIRASQSRRRADQAQAEWRELEADAMFRANTYHKVARARGYCTLCEEPVADCECVITGDGADRIVIYKKLGWTAPGGELAEFGTVRDLGAMVWSSGFEHGTVSGTGTIGGNPT